MGQCHSGEDGACRSTCKSGTVVRKLLNEDQSPAQETDVEGGAEASDRSWTRPPGPARLPSASWRAIPQDDLPRPREVPAATGTKQDADVPFETGIYTAVLVATFGGVRVALNDGRQAKMHPLFMLICAFPLFLVQMSVLFALMTDMRVAEGIKPKHPRDEQAANILLEVKVLMVVLLYCTNFRKLLMTLRLMVFTVNPFTWLEIEHPQRGEWIPDKRFSRFRVIGATMFLLPLPFIGLAMGFCVDYYVCVQSVSVILDSPNVKETIFNSLAIDFISGLNAQYWAVCATVFHLRPLEDFKFLLRPHQEVYERQDGTGGVYVLTESAKERIMCGKLYDLILKRTHMLRRVVGAARIEVVLSFGLILYLYARQLFIVLFALDTNILPVARDICSTWRMLKAGESGLAKWVLLFFKSFLLVDIEGRVESLAQNALHEQCFKNEEYFRMTGGAVLHVYQRNAQFVAAVCALMCAVVLAPQLAYFFYGQLVESKRDEEADLQDIESLSREVKDLREAMRRMQDSLNSEPSLPKGVFRCAA